MALQQVVGQLLGPHRIDDADDRQNQKAVPDLKHRRRQFADGILLHADHALALGDQHVDDQADVEKADLLERHEDVETLGGIVGKMLHDLHAEHPHQDVKAAEKDAHVESGAAVEHSEPDALLHIVPAVVALHHGDQMLMLQAFGLLQRGMTAGEPGGFRDPGQMIEKGRDIAVSIRQENILDRSDPCHVFGLQADEGLASFDVIRAELKALKVQWNRCIQHDFLRVR